MTARSAPVQHTGGTSPPDPVECMWNVNKYCVRVVNLTGLNFCGVGS